jgi:hypothetical protein
MTEEEESDMMHELLDLGDRYGALYVPKIGFDNYIQFDVAEVVMFYVQGNTFRLDKEQQNMLVRCMYRRKSVLIYFNGFIFEYHLNAVWQVKGDL